jgi:ATP/maltotriose-dependent transcriptional regulator MalT
MSQRPVRLAKITRPVAHGAVQRERLFDLLDAAGAYPATWVAGPPGAGKTTLITSYLEARALPHLWYKIDAGDHDPASLFGYLTCAAQAFDPHEAPTLPVYAPAGDPAIFGRLFFRELFSLLPERSAVVLDNLQDAADSRTFLGLIQTAIDELPAGTRFVLISRSSPASGFVRFLANRQLIPISADELKLTNLEATLIARRHQGAGTRLEETEIEDVNEALHGWAAGLTLFLQQPKHPGRLARQSGASAKQPAFDYFATEIFGRQPKAVRSFLVKLAPLPRVTAQAARRHTGWRHAGEILEQFYQNNLFTLRHTGDQRREHYYEFHPLMREFLLAQSRDELSATELRTVFRSAMEAAAEHGDAEQVISLAIREKLWDVAVPALLANAGALLRAEKHRTLADWIAALPRKLVDAEPWLQFWDGTARMAFDPALARARLTSAFARFKRRGDREAMLATWPGIIDTIVLEWDDFSTLPRWIAEGDRLLDVFTSAKSHDVRAHFIASQFAARSFGPVPDPDTEAWAERLWQVVERCPEPGLRILLACNLHIHYAVCNGDPAKCEQLTELITPPAGAGKISAVAEAFLLSLQAANAMLRGRMQESRSLARGAEEVAHRHGVHVWDVLIASQRAYSSLTSGDVGAAAEDLDRMRRLLKSPTRNVDVAHYHYLASHLALLEGNPRKAFRHSTTAGRIAARYGGSHQHSLGALAQAQVDWALGRRDSARRHLAGAKAISRKGGTRLVEFQACLCEAYFALDSGDTEACRSLLTDALALGAERDYLNYNWFVPAMVSRLLGFAVEHDIEAAYARRFIRLRQLWPVRVANRDGLRVWIHGTPLRTGRKTPREPLRLLGALVNGTPGKISLVELEELLELDSPSQTLEPWLAVNLHRLRKLLLYDNAIRREPGVVSLNDDLVHIVTPGQSDPGGAVGESAIDL